MEQLMELFPHIEPYEKGFLQVDKHHKLYWEKCGNYEAVPLLVIHGGPGAGCSTFQRKFFDYVYFLQY